jgi:hypothetical protein
LPALSLADGLVCPKLPTLKVADFDPPGKIVTLTSRYSGSLSLDSRHYGVKFTSKGNLISLKGKYIFSIYSDTFHHKLGEPNSHTRYILDDDASKKLLEAVIKQVGFGTSVDDVTCKYNDVVLPNGKIPLRVSVSVVDITDNTVTYNKDTIMMGILTAIQSYPLIIGAL